MDPTMKEVQARLERMLGVGGIHAVGLDEAAHRFTVRVDVPTAAALAAIRRRIEAVARPYPVTVVQGPAPALL
jgi:hypothetical protein